ncbi:MAG: T9SS type A sorting domain-containing protein [Flavobacteriales bacterium]|nr:T9SS type A sorting domain-containing protein [Flavobacteriales bacterium]MEB2341605.1 T9SS type A sorting domain-containing protein [Flavobacteriia bacterium]
MNVVRYATLPAVLIITMGISAQPTLVASGNVPAPGAPFTVHRGAYMAPPAMANGQSLDFSALASDSLVTYQWRDPATLPNGGDYPGAQFALVNGGPDTILYKATASGIERIGDTQTINALGTSYHLATGYSNSLLNLKLPLAAGDASWTDVFQGTFTVDGQTSTRNGAITGTPEAWGHVQLPGVAGTTEVLRVNTRITETIPLSTGLGTVTVSHVHNESAYYPLWGKFPVVRMVSDTLSSQFLTLNYAYTEWLDSDFVGIAEQLPGTLGVEVFPNPATTRAIVAIDQFTGGQADVQVMDMHGAVALDTRTTGRFLELPVEGLAGGVYQVVVTGRNGHRGTARIVVAH